MGRVVALVVLGLAAVTCRPLPSPSAQTAQAWGSGPTRWLLLAEDREELAKVDSSADFARFVAAFWDCRDEQPGDEENAFTRLFAERVAAADRLYEEPGVRGSLTPRGGALVLLGPPRILRYSQLRSPTLEGTSAAGARPTRLLRVEIWAYLPADLPPSLLELLGAEPDGAEEFALTFLLGGRHTRLIEGEALLGLAARAARRCEP